MQSRTYNFASIKHCALWVRFTFLSWNFPRPVSFPQDVRLTLLWKLQVLRLQFRIWDPWGNFPLLSISSYFSGTNRNESSQQVLTRLLLPSLSSTCQPLYCPLTDNKSFCHHPSTWAHYNPQEFQKSVLNFKSISRLQTNIPIHSQQPSQNPLAPVVEVIIYLECTEFLTIPHKSHIYPPGNRCKP